MNNIQLSQFIRTSIKSYKIKAQHTQNIEQLRNFCDVIVILQTIDQNLSMLSFDGDEKGRKVIELKAQNKLEALAAIDLIRNDILQSSYLSGQSVEDSIYITNEGTVWHG